MSSDRSDGVLVLTVGLDRDVAIVVADAASGHRAPATVVSVVDASAGRSWLTERSVQGEQLVVLAAFREDDAWGLSTLFARVRSFAAARRPELMLISNVPVPLLPVLITDFRGISVFPPDSATELRTHLDRAWAEPVGAVAS